MANLNRPISFQVIEMEKYKPVKYLVDADYAGKNGDVVWLDSAGDATDTNGAVTLGIQVGDIQSVATRQVESAGNATKELSFINVIIDPNVEFKGQISTFTQTDPYTCYTSGSCYDIAGTAGVQYVDAAASTQDTIKVTRISEEWGTGKQSEVGAYAKCIFRFNGASHAFGG